VSSAPFGKVSDRLDRRERERIRDEEEFNAEFRIVDSIGFRVGDRKTRSGWLHFDSDGRDFDGRDRELAVALWPQVDALWRRAVSRRQVTELLTALERAGDADTTRAIVLYKADGRIDHATSEARRLLAGWFATRNGRLPPKLDEWAAKVRQGGRYIERRNGSVLTVEAAGDFTLVLNEHRSADTGLTPREREVLRLVAQGLTNAEIARKLWVAPSTVAKHLEQAYSKLGVHSRTAAVARLAKLGD
jgi:DNA-binding CsgD family transcriptional regulator